MIKNFIDAFEYVNQRYIFNAENYPVMAKLTEQENKIFALKHGLLHMMKSIDALDFYVHGKKTEMRQLQWLILADITLLEGSVDFKKASLKIIINILSICHIAGITKEQFTAYQIPDEEKMYLIRRNSKDADSYRDHVRYYVRMIAGLLEKADHSNEEDTTLLLEFARGYIEELYLGTMYWFDDFWLKEFLNQIPSVMKS